MSDTPKLKRVVRFDNIAVDETYYTKEGFLIDHPIVTTVGIFEYMNPDGSTRRELRLPEEVFNPDSLASYEGKPIIITHNAGEITKENVEEEIIGTILSKAYQEGDNVRAKIVIHDTDKMKQSGLRELSLGYGLTLDETPGEWNGHPYDAIQRDIRINHLALVSAARAGEQARLNIDGKENLTGGPVMEEQNKQDSVLSHEELETAIADYVAKKANGAGENGDNATAETTPPVAEENAAPVVGEKTDADDVIQSVKDRRDRRDAETASSSKESALETIHQQDEDIDSLLKIIDQLKAQNDFNAANTDGDETACEGEEEVKKDGSDDKSCSMNMDAAEIDKIVTARIDVIRVADKLHLDGVDVMPLMDGKKAVIKAVLPKLRFDGKSVDYINALYDLAKNKVEEDHSTDNQRKQMFNADTAAVEPTLSMAEQARAKMIKKQNGGN